MVALGRREGLIQFDPTIKVAANVVCFSVQTILTSAYVNLKAVISVRPNYRLQQLILKKELPRTEEFGNNPTKNTALNQIQN